VHGFDEALRRAERYVRAGAEAIFVEAPESVAELERLARSFDVPQFANPLVGGKTPLLSIKEFEAMGSTRSASGSRPSCTRRRR